MWRYIIGFIGVGIGFLFVWKSNWLYQNFGAIQWAEQHLSSGYGGTRFFYKLLGVLIIFLAFLYMTGLLEKILIKIFTSSSGPMS